MRRTGLGYGFSDAPPWAMSLEQYAQMHERCAQGRRGCTARSMFSGCTWARSRRSRSRTQLPQQVRRVLAVGMPLFTPEEQQRQMEKYSEQPLKPATEGGHVLAAWRGCFAFRQPPYDLADVQRRFVEHLLAANPGAALQARRAAIRSRSD